MYALNLIVATGDSEGLTLLYGYLTSAVGILSILIGVVLVGSTIFAGIQYTTAGGDSGKVQKAKGRLASNVLVLALYIFSAAILNWLLPG
jgi:hypothetical protein